MNHVKKKLDFAKAKDNGLVKKYAQIINEVNDVEAYLSLLENYEKASDFFRKATKMYELLADSCGSTSYKKSSNIELNNDHMINIILHLF